jgi:hypothetical protein
MSTFNLTFTGEQTQINLQKAGDFSAVPLEDGLYQGSKTYTAYDQYLNDTGALFKLNPSVSLPYAINLATYPLAKDDPSLIPYTSFESATTEAIAQFEDDAAQAIRNNGGIPLLDGQWGIGKEYTEFNQYLSFNGVPYKPLSIPYTTQGADPTQSPDLENVQPWQNLSTLQVVMRGLNEPDEVGIYASDTASLLNNKKYIYDAVEQITWGVPVLNGPGEVIVDVNADQLQTSAATYTMISISTAGLVFTDIVNNEFNIGDLISTVGHGEQGDGGQGDYTIKAGDVRSGEADSLTANGNTAELVPVDNAVNMLQMGIKADGGVTINLLSPVSDYANAKGYDVTLHNTGSTRVHFSDKFHLKNTKLLSDNGAHIHYKGGDNNNAAVVVFGNDLDVAWPEYFESTKPFRIAEALTFTAGQGFGEVVWVSDGKVFFKWTPELVTDAFPSTGSVTGATTGQTESYTPSTVFGKVFGAPTNAGWDNVYLSTDLIGSPATAHVNATGVYCNGVRGGRSFGECGSLTVEGFETAGAYWANWFMHIKGILEAQKCADGHIFTHENNSLVIDQLILSSGSVYDSVIRYRARFPFCYGYKIHSVSNEGDFGESYFDVNAGHGIDIGVINIENNPDFSTIRIGGSSVLDEFTDRDTELAKSNYLGSCVIGPMRHYESLGPLIEKDIQQCEVMPMSFNYPLAVSAITKEWKSCINTTGSFNVKGLKIGNISATSFDVAEKFKLEGDLDPAKIEYDSSNYISTSYKSTVYKPAASNLIQMREPLGNTKRYIVDSVASYIQGVSTGTWTQFVLTDGAVGYSTAVDVSPTGRFFQKVTSGAVWTTNDYIESKLTGLQTATAETYTFVANIRELKLG